MAKQGEILVAVTSGVVVVDGHRHTIRKGRTHVREGHPIQAAHPGMFGPIRVDHDVEEATAAPGEKRNVSPAAGRRRRSSSDDSEGGEG